MRTHRVTAPGILRAVFDLHSVRNRVFLRLQHLPPHVLRRLSGGTTTVLGRTLDVQAQMLCFLVARVSPHAATLTPAVARQTLDRDAPTATGPIRPMRRVDDFDLGRGVRARWYLPKTAADARGPLIVYFHGGGFVTGSVESHDRFVRILADETGLRALSVEYRLAPEHPFPAAVDDALHAYSWALENADRLGADRARIAVAGDSAGGNLAAVVSRDARDRGLRLPALQVLLYPPTDLTRALESHRTFARGFMLDKRSLDYYHGLYAADARDERASPLLARSFHGLPPALVVTAGFDPLVDEGDAYALALAKAGTKVTHRRYDSLIHGFTLMSAAIDAAMEANLDLARDVRAALA